MLSSYQISDKGMEPILVNSQDNLTQKQIDFPMQSQIFDIRQEKSCKQMKQAQAKEKD